MPERGPAVTRPLLARLLRLERQAAAARPDFDPAEERRHFGEPAFPGADVGPHRTYSRQDGDAWHLTTITPAGPTTYVVTGLDGSDFT